MNGQRRYAGVCRKRGKMNRSRMLRKLAAETAARVPIPLDVKTRAVVSLVMYEALQRIWRRLNARERATVTKNPRALGTRLVLELVDPKTKKARPSNVVADRVLAELRPASMQIKPPKRTRKQRARDARRSRRPRSARAETS